MKMKKKEVNKLTKDQAIKSIDKLKKDLFNFRFQKIKWTTYKSFKKLRKQKGQ